jgi:glycosyltransferase involved in cell wall biosynthesis
MIRVGWVAHGTLYGNPTRFRKVPPPVSMRIVNLARWMNRYSRLVRSEMYAPDRRYDVVVFFKAMDDRAQEESARIKGYGGRVVFDANVNYYETWGDYPIDDTQPTEEQQAHAIAMTTLADWVVADSSYLLGVVGRYTDRASWIPDNIDLRRWGRVRRHRVTSPVRLVWSGVAKKAASLLVVEPVLRELDGFELVVVSDAVPECMARLTAALPCRYVRFTERRYARLLSKMDVIVSPRALANPYDLAHTEYKITLGMASGLPAVASPQQAYVEAIEDRGGGIVARDGGEWREALSRLRDARLRADLGALARETVETRYATPVVARTYEELLCSLV